jgi:hypothetical protein
MTAESEQVDIGQFVETGMMAAGIVELYTS